MSRYFVQEVYGKRFSGVNPITSPYSNINGSQLAKMKKSIPDMSLP